MDDYWRPVRGPSDRVGGDSKGSATVVRVGPPRSAARVGKRSVWGAQMNDEQTRINYRAALAIIFGAIAGLVVGGAAYMLGWW